MFLPIKRFAETLWLFFQKRRVYQTKECRISPDAASRCQINPMLLSEVYLAHGTIGCYIFTFETVEKFSRVHARFFAPDGGIMEDAATGSAAGSLSGYLVYHNAIDVNEFTIEQCDFMKRPSRIYAEVTGEKRNIEKVCIGGSSIIVAKGKVFL